MSAAVIVRSMLGVSPSAYEEACSGMGPEIAATVIACILERGGHINSAGGYLRDLTRRAEKGEFAIGPMLMALVRANGWPCPFAALGPIDIWDSALGFYVIHKPPEFVDLEALRWGSATN